MKVWIIAYKNGSLYSIGTGRGRAVYLEYARAEEIMHMIEKADGIQGLNVRPIDADEDILQGLGLDIVTTRKGE